MDSLSEEVEEVEVNQRVHEINGVRVRTRTHLDMLICLSAQACIEDLQLRCLL